MISVPIATLVAFAIHPQFWTFSRNPTPATQYDYIQQLGWQVGHIIVYLSIPLAIIMWLQLAVMLRSHRPKMAVAGGLLSLAGLVFMGGQFGMTLAQGELGLSLAREQALPAIQLVADRPGLMQLTLWGQLGAVLGPLILCAAMAQTPQIAPRWRGVLAIIGNLTIALALDIDAIMFVGELLILIGLWPVAVGLLKRDVPGQLRRGIDGPDLAATAGRRG
jgi:hypothetical protein